MPIICRTLFFLYSIFVLFIGGLVAALASGWQDAVVLVNWISLTTQNRIISVVVGIVLIVLGIIGVVCSFKREKQPQTVTIENGFNGQVSITHAAIKVIIMKAVKQVDGIKDIRTSLQSSPDGLLVTLQMMINPELPVPELTHSIQQVVKDYLQKIGGLEVAEVRVLVDEFSTTDK